MPPSSRPIRDAAGTLAALCLLAGAAVAPAAAQEGPDVSPDDVPGAAAAWSVDDLLFQEEAGDFRISPAGDRVAWVRSRMDREKGRTASHLWVTRLADGESWALTRGDDRNRSPRWSPDGRFLAFLSDRSAAGGGEEGEDEAGGSRIWALRLEGGEPFPVTPGVRGLGDFSWKGRSSDSLVFVARELRSRREREKTRTGDDAIAVEDTLDAPPTRLWLTAREDGEAVRLTGNRDWIQEMAVSPDGRRAVVRAGRSLSWTFDQRVPPATFLVDLSTGDRTPVEIPERTVPSEIEWIPDGSGFYFSYEHSSDPFYRTATVRRLGFYDPETRRFTPVELDWERGLGGGFEAVQDGFVAFLADGTVDRPARYERRDGGWSRRMLEGEHVPHIWGASVSEDGRHIAYRHSTASRPPQPYAARLEGSRIRAPAALAGLNPGLAAKPKPRTELVRWTGARGDSVEGILYYPLDHREGRPYPVVVSPHGGPAGRDADRWVQGWHDPYVLFNQRGAFVFRINYHGSCCYGLEWVESIAGGTRYYDLPLEDIERGVEAMIARGLFHPDSIVAAGWSNGAILSTALAVENPERYRALVAGAGDVEWISDWANVDFGAAFNNYYFGASPLEDPQLYMELSPFYRLDRVRAPTLIFFGTEDRNVPPSQGWHLYRALQQLGRVDVRFVLFPGEPHGLRELAHQRRKVEEEMRWLDRHLWGGTFRDDVELALSEEAPLNALLGRHGAARTEDGLYGLRRNGVLVPETVSRTVLVDGEVRVLEVGRFEVTRAQYAAFDSAASGPAGVPGVAGAAGSGGNLPAAGIPFERARAYAAWLTEVTGEEWRLPTEAERGALARDASGGVTLDWWAGYAPNPEDAERLRAAVAALPGRAPLVRDVGSPAADVTGTGPAGAQDARRLGRSAEPLVYDLAGNVAEWAVAPDGSGVPAGGSADRPADPRSPGVRAAPAYRGLRVVRGARSP